MSTMDHAEGVAAVIREYVTAWGMDRLRMGMGVLPEREKWVSEHEMRERFISANAHSMDRDEASAVFGRGLSLCERLGIVERDTAPQSTSIRLA